MPILPLGGVTYSKKRDILRHLKEIEATNGVASNLWRKGEERRKESSTLTSFSGRGGLRVNASYVPSQIP